MNGGKKAILAFFRQYLAMPGNADIEVSVGHALDTPTERLLLISVSHAGHETAALAMPPDDARAFADIAEQTMHRYPDVDGLANLILALRGGADLLERGAP
jgi:hypothetical protein